MVDSKARGVWRRFKAGPRRAWTSRLAQWAVPVTLADRVVLIEDGRIALDECIALPRPRVRGNPLFAQLEERILTRVLQRPA